MEKKRYINVETAKRIYLNETAWDMIDRVPTADVKEVVYCKNCKLLNDKYAKQGETDSNGNPQYYCNYTSKSINLDDYCSKAI